MEVEEAKRSWEEANDMQTVSQPNDYRFSYDTAKQKELREAKPWKNDPHYFTTVHISAVALVKMVIHAKSGGSVEIMGSIQGKIEKNAFVVMDVFPLPVEGTETRVSAHEEGNEFLVAYQEKCQALGRQENIIGWYHSHPGYGCWLSGIDVDTQSTNQQYQDPFLAIVIDPVRTMSSGKVDIGAFRTYPVGHNAASEGPSEYQTIPIHKIEDFGVHCKKYYPLEVCYFKSSLDTRLLDLLWNKYWASNLSSSPLIENKEYVAGQIFDLAAKIGKVAGYMQPRKSPVFGGPDLKLCDKDLEQLTRDAEKVATEQTQALVSQAIKMSLFRTI